MKHTPANKKLSNLAALLSEWIADTNLKDACKQWAAYWAGESPKPTTRLKLGMPMKYTDYDTFVSALDCVRFGWATLADGHTYKVGLRMKTTPILKRQMLAAVTNLPQPNEQK